MQGYNLAANILVRIFEMADKTLIGRKSEIVVAEVFLGMRVI
jgi:hypothetical protein